MLSSLNAYGGLSAAEILTLFGANSSSAQAGATVANSSPSSSSQVSASSNTAMNAIQAILAQSQIDHAKLEASLGGSASTAAAQAAYAEQTSSGSLISTSVTISTPGVDQQIADAVSFVNNNNIGGFHTFSTITTYLDPSSKTGTYIIINPVHVTAADAVNITMSNDGESVTAMQGAAFPDGLPSLTSIQQALDHLKTEDEGIGWNGEEATPETTAKEAADNWWNSAFNGSVTLVQLPANEMVPLDGEIGKTYANSIGDGGNVTTFDANGSLWALVLPQETVSVAVSDTQANG